MITFSLVLFKYAMFPCCNVYVEGVSIHKLIRNIITDADTVSDGPEEAFNRDLPAEHTVSKISINKIFIVCGLHLQTK